MVEKRKGRPMKTAEPGKRVSLGLKVIPELKGLLDGAAQAKGNTQSQEAEFRLNRSFAEDDLFESPEVRRWAIMMANTFTGRGRFEAKINGHPDWSDADWMKDPVIYQSAMFEIFRTMIRDMPEPDKGTIRLYLAKLTGDLLGIPEGSFEEDGTR